MAQHPILLKVRGGQRILNDYRKAEGKARKVETIKEETDPKWEKFRQSLKASFLKERKTYQDKVARLTADMEDLQAQKEAPQELKDVLAKFLTDALSAGDVLKAEGRMRLLGAKATCLHYVHSASGQAMC